MFYNAFSRNSIEERIVAIMKIKKVTVAAIFFSVLLVIGVITVFVTSAVSDKEVSETYLVEDAGPIAIIPEEENLQDLMQEYEKFGITRGNGVLYYHDEIIRYFLDGYEHESGNTISRYSEYNGAGTIDVHTVRNDIQNADGSTTLFGEIVDIVPYSQEEFDKRDLETLKQQKMVTEAAQSSGNLCLLDVGAFRRSMGTYSVFGLLMVARFAVGWPTNGLNLVG